MRDYDLWSIVNFHTSPEAAASGEPAEIPKKLRTMRPGVMCDQQARAEAALISAADKLGLLNTRPASQMSDSARS